MKNSNYWKKRMEELEKARYAKSQEYYQKLEDEFKKAENQISKDIEVWYARLAENNEISLAEARKFLSESELEEFKWTVNEYIKHGKANTNGQWDKQLENASAKVHISRLEAIQTQIQHHCEVLYSSMAVGLTEHLADIYENTYYRTAFAIEQSFEVGTTLHALDDRRIQTAMEHCWAMDGKTFSDRIWQNKEKLTRELNTMLMQSVIQGKNAGDYIGELAKKMNVSRRNASMLIMTESAAIASKATQGCYKDLGVKEFEFEATLDDHTSEICQAMDGQHFPMSEYNIGVNAPPLHPWCRSTTVPYFDDDFTAMEKRAARDENGKTYYVPADMTYPEWKKSFVDGGDKSELKEIKNDDTMSLKNKISDQDNKIDELKNQFSDATDGYSYDEWFSEFSSIEEGYGDAPDGDATFTKLKNLDEEIRNAEKQRFDLLSQKEKRGQLDTGFSGKIPDDKLDEYNVKAFEQIKVDTGYSDEQATKFHDALKEYFGGDYKKILSGETQTAKIIRNGIDRMPIYNDAISRGMTLSNEDIGLFSNLKPGETLPRKSIIESWSSSKETAITYSGISDYDRSSVILECVDNQTGVGVQHLSSFGKVESEVLSSAEYEVVEVVIENKYDYLSNHKEFLYFEEDLIDEELTMKGNIVCKIKVKEKH